MTTRSDPPNDSPLVAAYQRLIRAFNANDLAAMTSLFHPAVTYVIPGRSPVAGVAHGVGEHLAQLKRARELSGGTLHFEPRTMSASDNRLFVFGRITAEFGGRRLDSDHLVLFRFDGGLIVEGRTVPLDLYEFDEFWLNTSGA